MIPCRKDPSMNSQRFINLSFDANGVDGEMEAVNANEGAEFTLPSCGFNIEGCIFECWEISGSNIEEPFAVDAGDAIIVNGDITATALWSIEESYAPEAPGEDEAGLVEVETEEEEGDDGLTIEYEETSEEIPDDYVEETTPVLEESPAEESSTEMPSEVGSAVGGTAIAAIVLILAAAGIAVARKKKKKPH